MAGLLKSDLPKQEQAEADSKEAPELPQEPAKASNTEDKNKADEFRQKLKAQRLANTRKNIQNKKSQAELDEFVKSNARDALDHWRIWTLRIVLTIIWLLMAVAWQITIVILVCLQGAKLIEIDQTVLMTLITSTTANIFGLLVIVMKFVFPAPKR